MTKLGPLAVGSKLRLISRDGEIDVQVVSIKKTELIDCLAFIRIERVEEDPKT